MSCMTASSAIPPNAHVEQHHHRARELRREDGARGEAAPQVVLGRGEQDHGNADLRRERPGQRPDDPRDDVDCGQARDEADHERLSGPAIA